MRYVHTITGRTFTSTPGPGRFGSSSVDGTWDNGESGTIFPGEIFTRTGEPCWTANS